MRFTAAGKEGIIKGRRRCAHADHSRKDHCHPYPEPVVVRHNVMILNLYRGCTHGCIYCDSRSSCYHNPDFDHIAVKENALAIVRDDLRRKVQRGVVATGAMSDPYNPLERKLRTHPSCPGAALGLWIRCGSGYQERPGEPGRRCALGDCRTDAGTGEVLHHHSGPGSGGPFGARGTLSGAAVCRHGAAGKGGVFTGLLLMPVLPGLTDNRENLSRLLRQTAEAGGRFCYCWPGLTMREGQREYFYQALDREFPGLREKYEKRYGTRYRCTVPGAAKLYAWVREECSRLGLLSEMEAIIAVSRRGVRLRRSAGSGKPVFIGRWFGQARMGGGFLL